MFYLTEIYMFHVLPSFG